MPNLQDLVSLEYQVIKGQTYAESVLDHSGNHHDLPANWLVAINRVLHTSISGNVR